MKTKRIKRFAILFTCASAITLSTSAEASYRVLGTKGGFDPNPCITSFFDALAALYADALDAVTE